MVDWLTKAQLRRHLGALPVLYALLDVLQVRRIINRHCPTAAKVDHGTVAMVLILNRLMAPRPLYQVADWVAQTVLVYVLGIPASKFNDDRLGRTLDAIQEHTRDIWQDVVHHALVRFEIDLSIIFYDLTAFVVHGAYSESEYAKFGFAHNTPMDKRKFKTGLDVAADGNIPAGYATEGTLVNQYGTQTNAAAGVGSFTYRNDQPSTTLWYHDHTLGMTRLNVYAAGAGFWLIRGGEYDTELGYIAPGVGDDPFGEYTEIPIAIQDRSFNADGSLFYPDDRSFFEGLDPGHPVAVSRQRLGQP